RFRRLRSAETETNLRETDWQAGEHGLAELGWETALFYQLASGPLGQARRRQRAISPQLHLGRQRTEAGVRSRFHRAQAWAPASHALWLDENWREPHHRREYSLGEHGATFCWRDDLRVVQDARTGQSPSLQFWARGITLGGTCFCMSRTRRSASLRMN